MAGLRRIAAAEADRPLKIALDIEVSRAATPWPQRVARPVWYKRTQVLTIISTTPWPAAIGCANRMSWTISSSRHRNGAARTWGCLGRTPDGPHQRPPFGGMKIQPWFAADKSGFHIPALFQTSIKYRRSRRCDTNIVDCWSRTAALPRRGAIRHGSGQFVMIESQAVSATGGAGRVFRENTNGGIVTGDGMAWPTVTACRCATWNSCSTTHLHAGHRAAVHRSDAAAKAGCWSTRMAIATCRTTASGHHAEAVNKAMELARAIA